MPCGIIVAAVGSADRRRWNERSALPAESRRTYDLCADAYINARTPRTVAPTAAVAAAAAATAAVTAAVAAVTAATAAVAVAAAVSPDTATVHETLIESR